MPLFLQKFDVGSSAKSSSKQLPNISPNNENPSQATVKTSDGQSYTVNCGSQPVNAEDQHYISTQYHDELINELLQSHKYRDMCIIGPKVCSLSICLILCVKLSSLFSAIPIIFIICVTDF